MRINHSSAFKKPFFISQSNVLHTESRLITPIMKAQGFYDLTRSKGCWRQGYVGNSCSDIGEICWSKKYVDEEFSVCWRTSILVKAKFFMYVSELCWRKKFRWKLHFTGQSLSLIVTPSPFKAIFTPFGTVILSLVWFW